MTGLMLVRFINVSVVMPTQEASTASMRSLVPRDDSLIVSDDDKSYRVVMPTQEASRA